MKLIEYTRSTISEAKSVGTLYHFTFALEDIPAILNKGLKGSKSIAKRMNVDHSKDIFGTIDSDSYSYSFTRNKLLSEFGDIRIELDGDKMSEKYKIFPISELGANINRGKGQSETEERILTKNKLLPISQYVNKVTILNRQDKLVNSIKKDPVYKSLFSKIKSTCKKLNIQVELQP